MKIEQSFIDITIDDLLSTCEEYRDKGYRLAQIHPVMHDDDSITLIYTFIKGNEVVNLKINNLHKHQEVIPSVTEMFLQAFVYENEAAELYGLTIEGNVLDFKGNYYTFSPGVDAPMTIVTPEQLAARQKAARIKAAKAAKEKAKKQANPEEALEAEIAAKTAGLDPEKAAKVAAAMRAKAAKAKASQPSEEELIEKEIAEKTEGLDPRKAAMVAAGIRAKRKREKERAQSKENEGE